MARNRGGFDPDRLVDITRTRHVVPEILDAPVNSPAKGFTEVKIVGVGGAGNNAVSRMVEAGIRGITSIAVNTDSQALSQCQAIRKLNIGGQISRGLGAGGDPSLGEKAAEVSRDVIREALMGADMVFVTAGMGGGTGTGASPVVAEIARGERALTVAIVTTPFSFEGQQRRRNAEFGLAQLREKVDALIVVPNDRLLQLSESRMTLMEAFRLADDVLRQGVQGISDLVTYTGLINVDFADVKTVMSSAGTALMGIGEAEGDDRALRAARAAVNSPLLDTSIDGARSLLINVSGGSDLSIHEVSEAAQAIASASDPNAYIVFGAVVNPRPQTEMRVTVIATGLREAASAPPLSSSRPGRPSQRYQREGFPGLSEIDVPAFLRRRKDSPSP